MLEESVKQHSADMQADQRKHEVKKLLMNTADGVAEGITHQECQWSLSGYIVT